MTIVKGQNEEVPLQKQLEEVKTKLESKDKVFQVNLVLQNP